MKIRIRKPVAKWGKTESGALVGAIVTVMGLTFGLSPEYHTPLIVILSTAAAFATVE